MKLIFRPLLLSLILSASLASSAPINQWKWHNPTPQGNSLRAVAYGNNMYLAVGDKGTLLKSQDAIQWTPLDTVGSALISAIIFAQNKFVAVNLDNEVLSSSDGTQWETTRVENVSSAALLG